MTMKRCFLSYSFNDQTYEMIINFQVGEAHHYARLSGIPHEVMGEILERLNLDYEALEESRKSDTKRIDLPGKDADEGNESGLEALASVQERAARTQVLRGETARGFKVDTPQNLDQSINKHKKR